MDEQERRETTEAEKQYSEAGKKHTEAEKLYAEAERQHNEAGEQYTEAEKQYTDTMEAAKQAGVKRREEAEQRQAGEEARQQQSGAAVEQLTDATRHTESGYTVAQRLRHTASASLMHFPLVFKTVSDQADSVSGAPRARANRAHLGHRAPLLKRRSARGTAIPHHKQPRIAVAGP